MTELHDIRLSDYTYKLPESRIAQFPLEKRDTSKLLFYNKGTILHRQFHNLPQLLQPKDLLVFNDSKVIHARLHLYRKTGAKIEIFLLTPIHPTTVDQAMQVENSCVWKCIIGRKKKWKDGEVLEQELLHKEKKVILSLELIDREQDHVRLSWKGSPIPFSEVLESTGKLPLPPYLKREVSQQDEQQYQTVYAKEEGAVAAPTAGLHFSEQVLAKLQENGINKEHVTLHVSAGTFLPVKSEQVVEHDMHKEQFILTRTTIENLQKSLGHVVLVGTTSMRVIESLYWLALQVWKKPHQFQADHHFFVGKTEPYEQGDNLPKPEEVLTALLAFMDQHNLQRIHGSTAILIMPGYPFQFSNGLITNFHMPDTTLLLLVAAFIGEDWKNVYQEALDNEYRFLSYGDSSFLLPSKNLS